MVAKRLNWISFRCKYISPRTEMWKSVLLALSLAWFGSRGVSQLFTVCVYAFVRAVHVFRRFLVVLP